MSTDYASLEIHLVNDFVDNYLEVLDYWQREVDNIRRMHHDVWKGSRLSDLIWQHRAGSRVEKQTRILPKGGQTDVDYMFEVIGIKVESVQNDKHLYFKSCNADRDNFHMSRTFGQIFGVEQCRTFLENDSKYGNIFRNTFQFIGTEYAYLLTPSAFKTKVVTLSGLDYETDGKTTDNCPSIAGFGAMNEYDGVPCLRLSSWPDVTSGWIKRSDRFPFDSKWRSQTVLDIPLFLVPTGNPLSGSRSTEFRLSFSMVEIACFERLNSQMRKLYGISKYVFKELFSKIELLSSYHIKTLMLWKVEQKENVFWETVKPVEFMCEMISDLQSCVVRRELPHFFVENCNIYPAHKHSTEKVDKYEEIAKDVFGFLNTIMKKLAIDDLGISHTEEANANGDFKTHAKKEQRKIELSGAANADDSRKFDSQWSEFVFERSPTPERNTHMDHYKTHKWTLEAKTELDKLKEKGIQAYIAGYLTRLLSVITFSIQENFEQSEEKGHESIKEITTLFVKYSKDTHIGRLIPFVNSCIRRLFNEKCMNAKPPEEYVKSEEDFRSITAHDVLENWISNVDYSVIPKDIMEIEARVDEIGISITKFHQKLLPNDKVIQKMICILESENNGRCPRFYLDPGLFLRHLQIQKHIMTTDYGSSELTELLIALSKVIGGLSVKVPYLGKLSYRHAGVYLLKAYKQVLSDLDMVVGTDLFPLLNEKFNQRNLATNFDLR